MMCLLLQISILIYMAMHLWAQLFCKSLDKLNEIY